MMKTIVFIAVFLACSCTVFRQKDSSHYRASETVTLQTGRLDSMYSDLQQLRIRLQHESRQEWTEILPIGSFSYRPDSGFSGRAVSVRVYRDQSVQQWAKDSNAFRMERMHADTSAATVVHSSLHEQTARITRKEPLSQRWLLTAGAVVLLLTICVWYVRRNR